MDSAERQSEDDIFVLSMLGREIPSERSNARYRIISRVGEGAMGVAFYALRVAPDGEAPVVVKILRPWFVRQWGDTARLIVQKEAIALGRLNERVPPTPFVVRFIDTGLFMVVDEGDPVQLPFIVVEYVHGGSEGTTLTQRVAHSIRSTGWAFDSTRTARMVEGIAQGLVAVHDVGVIHRDLKPDNVLCCGFGDEEILKIADFGVARPIGVAATFGGFIVGTMGYAAPELATMDQKSIGNWSDVFSFACVVYFALTGRHYFDVSTPGDAIVAAVDPKRPSILDARRLDPELRANEQACRAIDYALSCGTTAKVEIRPRRADALATMLVPWLRTITPRKSVYDLRLASIEYLEEETRVGDWTWNVLRQPGTLGCVVRDVAWDSDGRCMAATTKGLHFWTGSTWREVDHTGLPNPSAIRFVRRTGPGTWLVGGDEATFATYTTDGVGAVRRFSGWNVRFDLLDGDIEDLAVLVGWGEGEPPSLCALSGRRWLKPLKLPQLVAITEMARIEDAKWFVVGRATDGRGFAGMYKPLDWDVERIDDGADDHGGDASPKSADGSNVRAFLACAGQWERNLGLAVGTGGAVVWYRDGKIRCEAIPGGPDLSAASVDAAGRGWAASAGTIWSHTLSQGDRAVAGADPVGRWENTWVDPSWKAPIIALFTDPGWVIAMTADGGIIEGRQLDRAAKVSIGRESQVVPTIIDK